MDTPKGRIGRLKISNPVKRIDSLVASFAKTVDQLDAATVECDRQADQIAQQINEMETKKNAIQSAALRAQRVRDRIAEMIS